MGEKIPRVLRGLFQRERRLLGLLARSARDAIVPSVRAILDRHDVTPGLVVSIQTFGSYAANFHSHVHAVPRQNPIRVSRRRLLRVARVFQLVRHR